MEQDGRGGGLASSRPLGGLTVLSPMGWHRGGYVQSRWLLRDVGSGHGGDGLLVGLVDLSGLFQS